MESKKIRDHFVKYFEKQGHQHLPSSSLIPEDDPTLLFANAGMNQFKNKFLGLEKPESKRAVTVQKVVRAGGKHNDLENVGHTARHHTFFEMLGNFSFGDYFKDDAIAFAWEFLTQELAIPKDKLYVTVFESDDDAAEIWQKKIGVPKDKIYRFGEKDNFWRMGDTGPCGPCSEIFFDHGPNCYPGADKETMEDGGDRFVEIWNLVFMQYNEDGTGQKPLPSPSVDTGSGLERVAAVMQNQFNNYDTDIFSPIIRSAANQSKKDYVSDPHILKDDEEARKTTAAMRVVADHARATCFLIADGVLPSNEGRGYVLRRIMRRGIRYGRNLTDSQDLFSILVGTVIEQMSDFYPYLLDRKKIIMRNVQDETKRFLSTLDQGTDILNNQLKKLNPGDQLDTEVVFKLYDTFGFPVDLTRVMAEERNVKVDESAFEARMEESKAQARASWKGSGPDSDEQSLIAITHEVHKSTGDTEFTGYTETSDVAQILALLKGGVRSESLKKGDKGYIICDQTCFYAESGGQVGDTGFILSWSPEALAKVTDCQKKNGIFILSVEVLDGELKPQTEILQIVDESRRRAIMSNHSATHLLHAALRDVLGDHVTQAGSLVDATRLRFDFTHNQPLNQHEILAIESLVNEQVGASHSVQSTLKTYDQAVADGALALFGEKYEDEVRVIKMGPFSMELCGGTHVSNTNDIRVFKIVTETGVSSGVRRIEALTGNLAFNYLNQLTEQHKKLLQERNHRIDWKTLSEPLNPEQFADSPIEEDILKLQAKIKNLEKSFKDVQSSQTDFDSLISQAHDFNIQGTSGRLVWAPLQLDDRKILSEMTDKIKDKVQSGIVVVIGQGEDSSPLIVSVTKDLSGSIKAGDVIKKITAITGGKGGGRPDFAQGAIQDRGNLDKAKADLIGGLN